MSRLERGDFGGMTLVSLERVTGALGASLKLDVQWRGEQLDRLMDAAHASLQQATAAVLASAGWIVRVEVSFNHFGERGRVDILAYRPELRILVVVEIKSALGDVQETIGRLDVKTRLAVTIARQLGWHDLAAVVPAFVIGDTRTARRVVAQHPALFERFVVRGRRALAWIRRPSAPPSTGLLWFANHPNSREVTTRLPQRPPKRPDSHRA